MVTLDTRRALHERDHQLAAFCATCERWAVLDLALLIAEGRGEFTSPHENENVTVIVLPPANLPFSGSRWTVQA
jgi:hypothetical protein